MLVKTVPKNYECLECGNQQYNFEKGCVKCGSHYHKQIINEDKPKLSAGDFVKYDGSTWIVSDRKEDTVNLMSAYHNEVYDISISDVLLICKRQLKEVAHDSH